ncbi:type VI secretion system tip protein TssI/VgrG [Polyangium aurulentum]|uniref:type VI secretion system tip protein TssI/VgrG n=1 Tax=Polyangium aurulentum TaxID=2567896 RepID=UPI0010AE1DE7|nr:type VI secretion system tip protein TssI/VgrG [Polyangium aurulentum]UQA62229.1 type VI secretion system tip protein VgrG [Polyangium aurulentum]
MSKNAQLSLESGDNLEVRTFVVNESVSASFQIDVIAMGADDIDIKKITGRPASFGISARGGKRVWSGVCAEISQISVEPDGLSTYAVRVAPTFWMLNHRRNHRIFQHQSVPDIVQKVLGEWKLPFELKIDGGSYAKKEYAVQYGETDHDFIRRLLVEEGISFFFQTPEGGNETKMILTDAPHTGQPREKSLPFVRSPSGGEQQDHITNVNIKHEVRPGRAVVRDFDFRRPSFPLAGVHSGEGGGQESLLEEYIYMPGVSNVKSESAGGGNTPFADKEGAYRHEEKAATKRAQTRTEAMRSAASRIKFNTTAADLAPGSVFSMDGHPHPDVGKGKKLLVTNYHISGDVNEDWTMGGSAVSADQPYRPFVKSGPASGREGDDESFKPMTNMDKPRIQGTQSAVVVGPKGEEIHADEHGRVRVQFPWDREAKGDEKGSCWIRVSQAWAGPGFGMITLPRVGQEVLVGFMEGDPDQPMVVGRMFDTTSPTPYQIPEHKTRTSLKSSSENGGNEITFEDKNNSELFYIQATKDFHKIVKNDELEETQGNRHLTVEGDLILSAKGNVIIQAGKELVVKGGPKVQINPPGDIAKATKPKELSPSGGKKKQQQQQQEQPKAQQQGGGGGGGGGGSQPSAGGGAQPSAGGGAPTGGKSMAARQNESLSRMNPGPSGKYQQIAAARKAQAEKYQDLAKQIGEKYNIPPAMALAWMNRESAFGEYLNKDGYSKFDGQGFGMFQVDKRYHTPQGGPADWNHIDQAMGIFNDYKGQIRSKNPGWTEEEYNAAALVAYNSGPGSVRTRPSDAASWAQLDKGTAHDDYSRDIWAEAQWYSKNLKW